MSSLFRYQLYFKDFQGDKEKAHIENKQLCLIWIKLLDCLIDCVLLWIFVVSLIYALSLGGKQKTIYCVCGIEK